MDKGSRKALRWGWGGKGGYGGGLSSGIGKRHMSCHLILVGGLDDLDRQTRVD